MSYRRLEINIPVECLRTVLDLEATGSISKTAENMSVTGPTIAHQLKKLQQMIGGELFEKGATGYRPTRLGERTIDYARKIIEANDHLISLTSKKVDDHSLRIGVPNIFIDVFLERASQTGVLKDIRIVCETSNVMERMLHDDLLDAALCFNIAKKGDLIALSEWEEEFVWCKARSFVVSPGAPVPILGFVECPISKIAIQALEDRGLFGRIVFTSADRYALKMAAKAGVGLLTVRSGLLDPSLTIAEDEYLPPLPPLACGIYCRSSFDAERLRDDIVKMFSDRV
jgi:DNA-binding transcriptional LysR family regulator